MANTKKTRFALSRAGLTPFEPLLSYDEADARAKALVERMTDEEKFDMVCGRGFFIAGCERLGIPDVNFTDASQGVHLRDEFYSGKLDRSVSFPSALMLTSTWNRKLAAEYARAVGEECRAGGIHVLLGPGMNIYRVAQCGRNFEYTGEDPALAAEMIAVYVTALQQTGVIATLKHFIANETEYIRKHSNTVVGRRALNEIYLPAFQSGVDAGALAVMTSYNYLNGEYCGQSATVINGLLRGELGFDHLVMTDWTSVDDGRKVAESGQDLEMPHGEHLKRAKAELLGSPEIDRMVTSIIRAFTMMGFLDMVQDQPLYLKNLPAHEEIAFRTACEGTVLLRNEGVLPLTSVPDSTILVAGNWAARTPIAGKGSGYVEGFDSTSYGEAIAERNILAKVRVRPAPTDAELTWADTVVICTGFEFEGESRDRAFSLPDDQNRLIARACERSDRVIVVITSGGGVSMPWHDAAEAIIQAPFGGQKGAAAIAEILTGKVNPSGKLAFTIEENFADSPGARYLPDGAGVDDPMQSLQPGAPKPEHLTGSEWPYEIRYDEGVYVGYRWYAKHGKPVRYWFGHGLSYTEFAYSDLEISGGALGSDQAARTDDEPVWWVSVSVKNTGAVAGAEVVQLYVEDAASGADRPERELKAFDKVFLEPGESATVRLPIVLRDLEYFDEANAAWTHAAGEYRVHVGSSYADLRVTGKVTIG